MQLWVCAVENGRGQRKDTSKSRLSQGKIPEVEMQAKNKKKQNKDNDIKDIVWRGVFQ